MKRYSSVLAGVAIAAQVDPVSLKAQSANEAVVERLQRRIEELEKKVKDLVGTRATQTTGTADTNPQVPVQDLNQEVTEAKGKENPKVTLSDQGFGFWSANGHFGIQIKGVLQLDSRTFFNDAGTVGNDGFLLRRARPIVQGTVFRDFDFQFVPDFGGTTSFENLHNTPGSTGLPTNTGGSLPSYATVGLQQFFAYNPTNWATVYADGEHWRLSPQGYYYWGPFGLLGEYVISHQKVSRTGAGIQPTADLEHTGWQIAASWVLTGEAAGFYGVVPRKSFDPQIGHWGAWQLVARFSEPHIDRAAFPLFPTRKRRLGWRRNGRLASIGISTAMSGLT